MKSVTFYIKKNYNISIENVNGLRLRDLTQVFTLNICLESQDVKIQKTKNYILYIKFYLFILIENLISNQYNELSIFFY